MRYFFREYKYDLLAGVITFVVAVLPLYFTDDPRPILPLTALAVILGTFTIVYLRTRHHDFFFISLANPKQCYDWVGRGDFRFDRTQQCFQITNADPGYIYVNCLNWSNYRYGFDFKMNTFNAGAIVRARDLSNYIMIQFRENSVQPHIRVNGMWAGLNQINPLDYQDGKRIKLGKWYSCRLTCDNDKIDVFLGDHSGNAYISQSWPIPNLQNYNFPLYSFDEAKKEEKEIGFVRFVINLEFGSIGLRTWDIENAFIKNILVEKI